METGFAIRITRKQSHCITFRPRQPPFAAPPSRLGRTRGQLRRNARLDPPCFRRPGVAKSCRLALALALRREVFVEDRILDNPGILSAAALARIDDERF